MSAGYQTEFDRENGISSIIETLGGASITQIFVHGITSLGRIAELDATLPGFEMYPERALVFARSDDLVCVLGRVDNQYLQFLSSLEIGPRDGNVIVASEDIHENRGANLSDVLGDNYDALLTIRRLIKRNKKIVLNPYITSQCEFKLAAVLETVLNRKVHLLGGKPDIVDYSNYKHNVKTKALELAVTVPEGDTIELQLGEDRKPLDLTPIQVAINRHIPKPDRVVVKGSHGFSGSSVIIVEDNPESIQKALSKIAERTDNNIYLVEVMLNSVVSPNILMHLEPGNGKVLCVGITDQLLNDNLMHEGNIYPSKAKTLKNMINSAQRMSQWLQSEGYCGSVGFDFVEHLNPETGGFEHFLAEINPRTNAAAYPKSLMEHLNKKQEQNGGPHIEAFLSTNIKTKASSFAELSAWYGHLFFNPKTGKGLVPYNTGCLEHGKFTLAVFGKSSKEVMDMYEDFKALLAKEYEEEKVSKTGVICQRNP